MTVDSAAPDRVVVISDVHLGNVFCRLEEFEQFLNRLPPGATLVLNGDIAVRHRVARLPPHARLLNRLEVESHDRKVYWVLGNHDRDAADTPLGEIVYADRFEIPGNLVAMHGHQFERMTRVCRPIMQAIRWTHAGLRRGGLARRHHAEMARRMGFFFSLLRGMVRRGAVRHARRHGFKAVTCGHVHYAEETEIGGIRYLNTGCWTSDPLRWVEIDGDGIRLSGIDAPRPGADRGQDAR